MIRLEEINGKNVWDILKLRVSDVQQSFVAPNNISIIEAYIAITHHGQAFPFGIYEDETPVGFCMIGFGADDDWEDAPDIARSNYNLWRFMIDERYQGKGYGRAAMKQIMDYIASEPCGPAEYCWLSYEPENATAKSLYASFGFKETGEWDGDEAIAILRLNQHDQKDLLIGRFVEIAKEILKDRLTGVYLHGSAVMGCYQPKKSDLDFLVVVNTALSDTEKRGFMDRLLDLDHECPGKGIEMSIVTKDVCNPFVYPTPFILHYSRMHTGWYRRDPEDYIRKMNGTDKDLAAHITVIRNRGICLYGLPIHEMFGDVPEGHYLDSILGDVSDAENEITDNPMYMILNLTRVLGYLREKKILSKKEGGIWGLKNLPERYHPLIHSALDEYESGKEAGYDSAMPGNMRLLCWDWLPRNRKRRERKMDYSQKISERQWNLPDKGELESRREATYIDDIIQKDHIQRKLLEHLDGIHTVFDGGAGSGRFSILLAKQGCRVTHFDISRPMIDKARELAAQEGVSDRITFVRGALEDLSAYRDREFDLVMSFDAPVSYTYPNQNKVIGELVRIAGKRIMISVSSRLGSLPYLANPIQKNQFILDESLDDPFVHWCVANRKQMIAGFTFNKKNAEKLLADGLMGGEEEIAQYEQGGVPWCITYTFMPDELEGILSGYGVKNICLSGPGAYGRTIPREILVKIMENPDQKKAFLDFCYRYDSNSYVCGMGKDNLLAVGDI